MDPISQGIVGAALAQSKAKKNNIIKIGVIGFMAGMVPDLDVLIKSSTDPILSLEYHRQFTHSLLFIPFGAMIVALIIFPLIKRSLSFKTIYVASFLGYATHGLLDACTSYTYSIGLSPMSGHLNSISVVDPLFTIPTCLVLTQ